MTRSPKNKRNSGKGQLLQQSRGATPGESPKNKSAAPTSVSPHHQGPQRLHFSGGDSPTRQQRKNGQFQQHAKAEKNFRRHRHPSPPPSHSHLCPLIARLWSVLPFGATPF
eukprot:GSA25T00008003001.1